MRRRNPREQTQRTSDQKKPPSDETKQQPADVKRPRDGLKRHRAREIRPTVAGIARSDETVMQAEVFDAAARSRRCDVVIGRCVVVNEASHTSWQGNRRDDEMIGVLVTTDVTSCSSHSAA
jgi:hypothetical protein